MVRKILLSLIAVLGLCVYGFAQNRQVSGKVADAEGKPVAGATVMVDGTSTGTTTGTDGKFTIAAPADATLAVSFIGYETRKVAVAGKTHVEVVMHEDAQAIENVVVTAFGTTTKKDLTGSIATIRGEELAKRQVSTVSKMLEGAVPGVQLTTATNQPGTDAAIYVRGVGSLNAGTGALIVLDGSPYQGSLSDINPADIESISVLKDASSTAIYGARGSNGVIVINTKKAQSGSASFSYSGSFSIGQRPRYGLYNQMNSRELMEFSKERYEDRVRYHSDILPIGYAGLVKKLTNKEITHEQLEEEYNKMANNNTDWFDLLFRNSFNHKHNLSITGG